MKLNKHNCTLFALRSLKNARQIKRDARRERDLMQAGTNAVQLLPGKIGNMLCWLERMRYDMTQVVEIAKLDRRAKFA